MSLVNWYRKNFTRTLRHNQKKSPFEKSKRRPTFDTLEDRTVPSGTSLFDFGGIPDPPPAQNDGDNSQGIGSPDSTSSYGSGSQGIVPSASGSGASSPASSGTYQNPTPDGVLPTPPPWTRYVPSGATGPFNAVGWGSAENIDQTESGSPATFVPGAGNGSMSGQGSGSGSANASGSGSGTTTTQPDDVLTPPPSFTRILPPGDYGTPPFNAVGWGSAAGSDQTASGSPSTPESGSGSGLASTGDVGSGSGSSADFGSGSASPSATIGSTSEDLQPPPPSNNVAQGQGSGSAASANASGESGLADYGSGSQGTLPSASASVSFSPASSGTYVNPTPDGVLPPPPSFTRILPPSDYGTPLANVVGWGSAASADQTASGSPSQSGSGSGSTLSGSGSGSASASPGSGSGSSDISQQAMDAAFATMA